MRNYLCKFFSAALCALVVTACSSHDSSASTSTPDSAQVSAGAGTSEASNSMVSATQAAPRIGHVFVIVLENEGYAATFGSGSRAPYLATTLPSQGALLTQYYGAGHNSNDNYLTMISGQAPNPRTQLDCRIYSDWTGSSVLDANGQVTGSGCVYPPTVKTIVNQLEAAGLTWRGYMEDMGNDLTRDGRPTCSHPAIGSPDKTQRAGATDGYATRHNPFMYFHSIIDNQADCDANVVNFSSLASDLQNPNTTRALTFITPNLCNDGHDATCTNNTGDAGTTGGLTAINAFLKLWVPKITASPAFQKDGLLIITFDEADTGDTSACCNEPSGPNTATPGFAGTNLTGVLSSGGGAGGGRIGAVLLSPFIKPGTVSNLPYNHYSMLRSVEDIFGLAHLGYTGQTGLAPFGRDVYSALP